MTSPNIPIMPSMIGWVSSDMMRVPSEKNAAWPPTVRSDVCDADRGEIWILRPRACAGARNIYSDLPVSSHIPITKETEMDWDRVEGNWKQARGKIKEQWGKLTDDDLDVINGRRDQLEGKLQERYGYAQDQVRRDVDDWYSRQTW